MFECPPNTLNKDFHGASFDHPYLSPCLPIRSMLLVEGVGSDGILYLSGALWEAVTRKEIEEHARGQTEMENVFPTAIDPNHGSNLLAGQTDGTRQPKPVDNPELRP